MEIFCFMTNLIITCDETMSTCIKESGETQKTSSGAWRKRFSESSDTSHCVEVFTGKACVSVAARPRRKTPAHSLMVNPIIWLNVCTGYK